LIARRSASQNRQRGEQLGRGDPHSACEANRSAAGRLDEAEHALRRAIELDPNTSQAIGSRGNVLHFAAGMNRRSSASLARCDSARA
jgi:hypothetical protein